MVNVNIELWHICENQYYWNVEIRSGDEIIYWMVMEHQFEVWLFLWDISCKDMWFSRRIVFARDDRGVAIFFD